MKKIVGIIAAISMAVSVFAVDFSAGTKIGGSLFNFKNTNVDGVSTSEVKMLEEHNDSHDYANPNFSFNISDDKAGASIKITTDGYNEDARYALKLTSQTIWFKPIEMLKISVGHSSTNLNSETISYTWSQSGIGDKGYSLALTPIDGFEFDLFFSMGRGGYWLDTVEDSTDKTKKKITLQELSFKAQYAADFGTINGIFQGKNTFKDLKFGVGYKNTFGPVNMFANVLGFYGAEEFQRVRIELDASGSVDALNWQVFIPVDIATNEAKVASLEDGAWDGLLSPLNGWQNVVTYAEPVSLGLLAKASYRIDPVTVYLQIQDKNLLMKDAFRMTIKPGVSGNCGLMGWDIGVQFDIAALTSGKKTTIVQIDVPVSFSVSF